jgi:hypothetical protein
MLDQDEKAPPVEKKEIVAVKGRYSEITNIYFFY